MRVAVIGASGFLGHDFIRTLIEAGGPRPIAYSMNAGSLSNLARHPVEIRLVSYRDLLAQKLDRDVGTIVNFAHPFGPREGLSCQQQVVTLCRWLEGCKRESPDLRVVHVSTLSVYEPFRGSRPASEEDRCAPPATDSYSVEKWRFEQLLARMEGASSWQLILRPTVVYGPFCVPWTDRILRALSQGDVAIEDTGGRIQPTYGTDVSRFICGQLTAFRPGVLNLAAPSVVTWRDLFQFFADIVGKGRLIAQRPVPPPPSTQGVVARMRGFALRSSARPGLVRLLEPAWSRVPVRARQAIYDFARPDVDARIEPGTSPASPFTGPFFAQDRLVDRTRFCAAYPDFRFTELNDMADTLRRYYRFRFTDDWLA